MRCEGDDYDRHHKNVLSLDDDVVQDDQFESRCQEEKKEDKYLQQDCRWVKIVYKIRIILSKPLNYFVINKLLFNIKYINFFRYITTCVVFFFILN